MTTPVYSNRKVAKIRFFGTYALSVILILVLFSSFLAPESSGEEQNYSTTMQEPVQGNAAIYKMLHDQMRKLDEICTKVAAEKSIENLSLLQAEEAAFHTGMENIRLEAASIREPEAAKEVENLIDLFSRTAAKQVDMALGAVSTVSPGESSAQMGEMKTILLQKEQRIAELEEQNKQLQENGEKALAGRQPETGVQATVTQRESGDAAEWKRKYERLKTDNDRLKESNNRVVSQTNELKKSYKDVVDDNRRLLAQLQAARAGRN